MLRPGRIVDPMLVVAGCRITADAPRRPRHSPAEIGKLARAALRIADYRPELVGIDVN